MTVKVTLDHRGIDQLLRSAPFRAMVGDVAEAIAADVQGQHPDAEVVVDRYETDRAAASVTVRDVRAMGWQGRDGLLTRAAAAQGAEVTARGA